MISRISPRSTSLLNVGMPNYLPILLFCVIYASMFYTSRGENQVSDRLNITENITPKQACKGKRSCSETNSDTVNSISYGKSLISERGKFKLGFFVRGGRMYLGIWYNGTYPEAITWVANRDKPIPLQLKHNCYLVLGKDGKARLLDSATNHTYWSSEHLERQLPSGVTGRIVLKLTDNGNLISMVDKGTRGNTTLWQSFNHPTDTFLYGMDIRNDTFQLTSWISPENPAQGSYRFKRVTNSTVAINKINSFIPYWENSSSSLPPKLSSFLDGSMAAGNAWSLRLVLNHSGSIQLWGLDNRGRNWSSLWIAPEDQCDLFEACGNFGVCDAGNGLTCKCLPGFKPSDPDAWESRDFSGNQCSQTTFQTCDAELFLRLPMVKVPQNPASSSTSSEDQCKDECLSYCGCRAYSYDPGQSNCQLLWTQDLYHIQEEYYDPSARTLSIRVAPSDIVNHKGMLQWVKAGIATTFGVVILFCCILCILIRLRMGRVRQRAGITEINKDNDIEDIEIPFVDYESILVATDNFSDENKLGVGGFGPVYKGKLVDGNVVAVKRLSAASVQGIEEFRNEVILIAKLQHRNLVRVLAYCIKEEEKILIYEYMSNKSLDAFLFDQTISPLLDWIKRFNIILGIARGLLYLHQDSRLRIIHRDLKPSNILLDEELNPKISDFGLARIAAGNEMATSTVRVVGTHGYMSPEYVLDGYFSIKSDVYSFGIIVLEIISGKRCTGLLHSDDSLISLLGYAWTLWKKGKPLELVDKSVNSCDSCQVKRCINVGLLCVQEDPSDRPTMSTVLLMLGGDNMNLPYPKQPVFVARRRPPSETSSSSKFELSSNAELTMTLEAR